MGDVFVFGSNLAGRHGKGAALYARKHYGAEYGNPVGRQGNSYAIPTKDSSFRPLPLNCINSYIQEFIIEVYRHPFDRFLLTKIGSGLAGYTWEKDILPLFPSVWPDNLELLDG